MAALVAARVAAPVAATVAATVAAPPATATGQELTWKRCPAQGNGGRPEPLPGQAPSADITRVRPSRTLRRSSQISTVVTPKSFLQRPAAG